MKIAFTIDLEVAFEVEGTLTPYDPGKRYGDPEKCYPPEGGNFEDPKITSTYCDENGNLKTIEIPEKFWRALGISHDNLDKLAHEAVESLEEEDV